MSVGSRSATVGSGGGPTADVNVTQIGGVPVTAAAKTDAMASGTPVLEVGAREQLFNGATWDRARSGFVGIVAAYVGYQNTIPIAIFHAAPVVRADGEGGPLETDASGNLRVVGTFSSASVGLVGAAAPASADYAGFLDAGGLLRGARTYDTDTGAGTENTLGVNLRVAGPGGSVGIDGANPLPVAVVNNITGTVDQGAGAGAVGPWSVRLSDGAAFYDGAKTGQLPTALGQTTGAASLSTTLSSEVQDNTNGVVATVDRPLAVSTYSPFAQQILYSDPDVSWKVTPGNVFSAFGINKNTVKRYLQLFNKASAPVGGDVPVWEFPLPPAGAAVVYDSMTLIGTDFFGTWGLHFTTGIASGYSTTSGTYTAGAAADGSVGLTYK